MATVTNPTRWSLYCAGIARQIPALETYEITDAAARTINQAVFVVELDENPEDGPELSRGQRAAQTRAANRIAAQRGSEIVESDDAPDRETR